MRWAPGHELLLCAGREAPMVGERAVVNERPGAGRHKASVAQLVAEHGSGIWELARETHVHSPPGTHELCAQFGEAVTVATPAPNLRRHRSGRLRQAEAPTKQIVSQINPVGRCR